MSDDIRVPRDLLLHIRKSASYHSLDIAQKVRLNEKLDALLAAPPAAQPTDADNSLSNVRRETRKAMGVRRSERC